MKKNNDLPCPVYYPMKGWYIVTTQVGTTKYARFGRIPNPLPPSSPIFFPLPHLLHAFFFTNFYPDKLFLVVVT